jgi:hypothetical protein
MLDRRSLLPGFSILYWGDLYFTVFDSKVLDKVLCVMLIEWEAIVMLHLAPRPTRDMRLLVQHSTHIDCDSRESHGESHSPLRQRESLTTTRIPYDSENPLRQRESLESLRQGFSPPQGFSAAGILACPFYGDMAILL